MKTIKVFKNGISKTINADYKKDYINAGWSKSKIDPISKIGATLKDKD